MERKVINPTSPYDSTQYGFPHAIKSNGTTTIHCAGQIAWDKEYKHVGGDDIGAQAKQSLSNLKTVLVEAGTRVAKVVRVRTYVVGNKPEYLEPAGMAIAEFYGDAPPG